MTNANVTDENDPKYLDDDTKVCVARATIEKDKYVGKRDLNNDGDTNDEGEGAEDYFIMFQMPRMLPQILVQPLHLTLTLLMIMMVGM